MKRFIIVLALFCGGFLFAQTAYKHTTNTLECTLVDNGIIGDNASGTYAGLKYLGGNNVIYSGGFVSAITPTTGNPSAGGMCGSYNMADWVNSVPFMGFISDHPIFDQIGSYVVFGAGGDALVYTYSKIDQSVIFLRFIIPNTLTVPTLFFHMGIIIDFDLGPGNNYANNSGGYDPARNLIYMFDATTGTTDTNYYGVMLLNVPSNSLHGQLIQNYSATREDVATYLMNNDFSSPPNNADHRLHISMPGGIIPAGEERQYDFAIVCGTSLADLQNTVDNVAIPNSVVLPVELTSFTVELNGNQAMLKWTTATELNNYGFEIQRKVAEGEFVTVGFVDGNGTTAQQNEYSFTDANLDDGKYSYRIKQVDFNGTFEFSKVIEVDVRLVKNFELAQNYPNPFNPVTTIEYVLQEKSYAKLTVLNSLGEEVAVLVNEEQDKGFHQIEFDGSKLSSGVYFYRIQSGNFTATKKLVLMK